MLQNSFTFIPGIGPKTETYYWKEGVITWEDFEQRIYLNGLGNTNRKIIIDYINKAKEALKNKAIDFFAEHLPQKEYWRLYKEFYDKTVFLDIETTGLSLYYDIITLIGTFNGKEIRLFVKDNNLKEIVDYLKSYDSIITFNGTLFDIPFLKKEFPEISIPPVHIDLRYLCKNLGITGSLKSIEKRLGIRRKNEIQKMNGREAVVLWNRFIKEDDESLAKLVLYNVYDTTDLKKLMDYCYERKIRTEFFSRVGRGQRQRRLFRMFNKTHLDFSPPVSNFSFPNVSLKRVNNVLEVLGDKKSLLKVIRERIKKPEIKLDDLIRKIKKNGYKTLSVGIDLTGSEAKASGFCILDGKSAHLSLLKTDEEIFKKAMELNPAVISIDSPLSIPRGRDCASDTCECRKYGIMRECERILKKRGVNVYPCLIPSMQKLTLRGMRLAKAFEEMGLLVIESYPGAAQDILGFPRKRIDLKALEIDLMNMGIKPLSDNNVITHDELDALTSALVGYFYLANIYEAIGNPEEKYLIVPNLKRN